MPERQVERDPKPYPSKQEGKANGRTKQIEICYGMGSEKERKYWACPGVVEAERPIGQWAALKRCSQQTKMVSKQQG